MLGFDDGHVAVYTDPRRFGWIELHGTMDEVLAGMEHIGPEPLALEGVMDGAPCGALRCWQKRSQGAERH